MILGTKLFIKDTLALLPLSNPETGTYFGSITYSAVTKMMSRFRDRLNEHDAPRRTIGQLRTVANPFMQEYEISLYFPGETS